MIKEDIRPYNNKKQRHGYWEVYLENGIKWFNGNYINGQRIGYFETYTIDNDIDTKRFYIL